MRPSKPARYGSAAHFLKHRYVADLFGGRGGVGDSCCKLGVAARVWDLEKGEEFDLTRASVCGGFRRDVADNKVIAGMIATPCRTWGPGGNRSFKLRSRLEPWGRTDVSMTAAQSTRLQEGNATMRAALKCIHALHKARAPWIHEHPSGTFAYMSEEWQRLLDDPSVMVVMLDQCMFGCKWRKRTMLVCGNLDEDDVARLRKGCTGKNGYCSRTGQKHFHLEGKTTEGVPWTSIAQRYPARLYNALAHVLCAQALAEVYNAT